MAANTFPNDPTTGSVTERVSDAATQAKNKVSEFGSTAADKIDQNRGAAASGLASAASSLHQRADQLPGGPNVTQLAHNAADKLNATADYVREHDVNAMMSDVQGFVKRNPGPSLVVAGVLGFLIGRTLSRD